MAENLPVACDELCDDYQIETPISASETAPIEQRCLAGYGKEKARVTMHKQLAAPPQFGLSNCLAALEAPVTMHATDRQESVGVAKTDFYTFGDLAALVSEPLIDAAVSAEAYRAMTDVEKHERDMELGSWLAGQAVDTHVNDGQLVFMQSLLVFDLVDLEPQEFEDFRTGAFGVGSIAALMHSLRGHTGEKNRIRVILPLFEPISLSDANLIRPDLSECLGDLGLSGRVIEEGLTHLDRRLALPAVSQGDAFWFQAFDGPPIFPDSFIESVSGRDKR